MKTATGATLALALAWLSAGCVAQINSCSTWVQQSWMTDKAWRARKWMYEDIPCESSFKAGFKAGYKFANCGGDSCQPPGPSHFWSAGGMTEQDQRDAQAWCDGFTHGTLAAQQDGKAGASALDAQTAQPPEGVPDVYYYSNANPAGSIGAAPYAGEFAPSQFLPTQLAGQFSPTPLAGGQFGPPVGQMPAFPASTFPAAGIRPVPDPMSANWSQAAAPADVAYPPAAPQFEPMELATGKASPPPTRTLGSPASPGIGSLRTIVSQELAPVAQQPAPATTSTTLTIHPATADGPSGAIAPANSAIPGSPKGAQGTVPTTPPTPSAQSPAAPQWELPIIRD